VGHLKWWDHIYDSWKKNFKKTSTTTIIKTKIEDVAEKSSVFVVVTNNSDKVSNISALISIRAHIINYNTTYHMTFDFSVSSLNSSS
jgi:hypothetical protein